MDRASKKRVIGSFRQSSSETNEEESEEYREEEEEDDDDDDDDDDISVIAVIQVDKDVSEKRLHLSHQSNMASVGQLSSCKKRTEVILLGQQAVGGGQQHCQRNEMHENRRVIDLSDRKSKMALRKQLQLESASAACSDDDEAEAGSPDYGNMEILQKLPSDTVVIKHDAKTRKDDSDYVRDSTETNSSGGSSSTSGYAAGKVKRIHRVIRSNNRNTVEVRRNPMRVTKKGTQKDVTRPRQRLLSAKRKEAQAAPEPKRSKLSTMPYMNTRSVTRRMYTVGAIYQAPTIKDTKEWKQWPVHGMHERPVFHPQVGLATEYMGRYFVSLDGLSYREIVDHPATHMITSDPHWNFSYPTEGCQERRIKAKVRHTTSKSNSNDSPQVDKSFAGYMHRSLHYVLAYCAQVMTPAYRKNVKDKIKILQRDGILPPTTVDQENLYTSFTEPKDDNLKRSESEKSIVNGTAGVEQKRVLDRKQLDNYSIAMSQSVKESNQYERVIRQPHTSTLYLADPQKNLITLKNVRTLHGGQLIFQDVVRPIQKNSLIFVKAAGIQNASHSRDQVYKTVSRDLNFAKLEDTAISDETLMEMSSVYTNFVSTENAVPSHSSSSIGNFPRRIPPKIAAKPESFVVPKRVVIDRPLPCDRRVTENESRVGNYNVKSIGKGSDVSATSNAGTTWYTNDASEIAKILSEYNRSIARKSAIQSTALHASPTVAQKANLLRANQRQTRVVELRSNNEAQGCSGQNHAHGNQTAIKLSQDKWRRFYPTVEFLNESSAPYKVALPASSTGAENRSNCQEIMLRHGKVDNNVSATTSSDSQQREKGAKSNSEKKEDDKKSQIVPEKPAQLDVLQELLEDTAMLYCAATGTHQDDLANYIDSLDAEQSVQWLDMTDTTWSR